MARPVTSSFIQNKTTAELLKKHIGQLYEQDPSTVALSNRERKKLMKSLEEIAPSVAVLLEQMDFISGASPELCLAIRHVLRTTCTHDSILQLIPPSIQSDIKHLASTYLSAPVPAQVKSESPLISNLIAVAQSVKNIGGVNMNLIITSICNLLSDLATWCGIVYHALTSSRTDPVDACAPPDFVNDG